jgi:flagellar hook protein FlgE
MSLFSTLYIGVSGMSTNGSGIEIAGDNIANVNTVGFKRTRANFGDVIKESLESSGSSSGIGSGSVLLGVSRMYAQGAMVGTGNNLDLAISGEGFFVVNANAGIDDVTLAYTRAGQFSIDKDGFIVNESNYRLQGHIADADGNLTRTVSDLKIALENIQPKATSDIALKMNLDNRVPINANFDPNDADTTSDYTATVTIYDSVGKAYDARVYFEHVNPVAPAADSWDVHVMVGNNEVLTHQLGFDNTGALVVSNRAGGNWNPDAPAAQNVALTFDPGLLRNPPVTSGLEGITSFASPSTVLSQSQDGFAAGSLVGIDIDKQGVMNARYSNGRTFQSGRVILAKFNSKDGLRRVGDNLYRQTQESGPAALAEAATGGRGVVHQATLEQSNVDISEEFIDMIRFQRAFQANSRTVTTTDELLVEVVNLKR